MENENKKKISIIEYVYIIEFAIQLYLWIGVSEKGTYKSSLTLLSLGITILLFFDIATYTIKNFQELKGNKFKLLITKLVLTLIPQLMLLMYNLLSTIVLYPNGLKNTSQVVVIESTFIIISSILFGIVIIWNAKISGFFYKHWVSLILCCYLLVWFLFGLLFYSIDYNMQATYYPKFNFNDSLLKEIQSRNIISDDDYKLDSSQEEAVRAIFKNDEDKIDYLPIQVNDKEIIISNNKVGSNWASYYYENLIKEYNAFDIIGVSELKLNEDYLNNKYVTYGKNYLEYFNKDYMLVKVKLFNSDEKNAFRNGISESILFEGYDSNYKYTNIKQRDLYLIFEKNNYKNYIITKSKLPVNIFLNCLSESNTFMDDSIINFKGYVRNGSSSVTDYLYYSATVITTLGFGDITPIAMEVRVLTMIEVFLGLLLMGLFLATVTSTVTVTAITLNNKKISIVKGNISILTAIVTPTKASNKAVIWSSSDSAVATIDYTGKVAAVGTGTAKITCTAADGSGKSATCNVTVTNPVTIATITLNNKKIGIVKGNISILTAKVAPTKASNKEVIWSSSDSAVATIDNSGKVIAVGTGTTIITCTAADGSGKSAACNVTVTN